MRRLTGEPGFTMPYWNYPDPAARALPPRYRIGECGKQMSVGVCVCVVSAELSLVSREVAGDFKLQFERICGLYGRIGSKIDVF